VLAVLSLVGCPARQGEAPQPDQVAEAVAPSEIRIGIHSDILSFDPHRYNEMLSYALLRNIYEPLTTFDPQLRVMPLLAESWENPDEQTWRFHLRHDVRFHDGSAFDAGDVVFSLERVRNHPESALASYMVQVDEVSAVGEHTVEIRTLRPFPILLNKLAYLMILPAGSPDDISHPIGTGPYRLERWEPARQLTLAAFDDYWQGRPEIDRAAFRPVRDPEKRVADLIAGNLDLVREVPPWLADRVQASRAVRLERVLGLEVQYLQLHADTPPFDDPRVRHALDLALDRERLAEEIQRGYGRPVGQLVSANVFGFDPAIEVPAPDLEEARRLLAEAGYPNGFATTLVTREGRNAEPIARQLAEVGVRVEVSVEPWTDLYPRLSEEAIPFYYGAVLASSADSSDVLDGKGHSREPARGYGSNNFGGYGDPEVDALIERSGTTLEMVPRRELLQEAMREVVAARVYLPLFVTYDLYGIRQEIEWPLRVDTLMLVREMRRRGSTGGPRR
jgi:peptide/nickel transport system substrate-binding protein